MITEGHYVQHCLWVTSKHASGDLVLIYFSVEALAIKKGERRPVDIWNNEWHDKDHLKTYRVHMGGPPNLISSTSCRNESMVNFSFDLGYIRLFLSLIMAFFYICN